MTDQDILQFVAITAGGRAYDIDFPLHPETRSAASVADLVTRLLEVVSEHAGTRDDVSEGDILQGLAMTLAIRGRMLEGDLHQVEALSRALYASAWGATSAARAFLAARA